MPERKPPRNTGSSDRDALHRLVDELPQDETTAAELFLEYLKGGRADRLLLTLATASWDDEPETDEERRALEEAREDVREGRLVSMDEVKREFGI